MRPTSPLKACLLLAAALSALGSAEAQVPAPKREIRGVWLSTHLSLDWPNRTQTPTQQRAALLALLDHNKATGLNSVFFQVRSQGDAMYASSHEPWSYYLTGTQGVAPNPLWDPLQFALEESRKRGLEFHAWINPYRAVSDAAASNDPLKYAVNHVSRRHPEWLLTIGNVKILNPGLPAVRDYVHTVVMDIVQRYDIDGLHFDDYFYQSGTINDRDAYLADPRGFPDTPAGLADWRRDNVNLLVARVGASIRALKPWVKFGISPSGIYLSDPAYPSGMANPALGSWTATGAFQHFRNSYADTLKWLREGWIDYLAPQLYWHIGQTGSDYQLLLPWWKQFGNDRHMYIGLADYKMNTAGWTAPSPNHQIAQQIALNRGAGNIGGQIHFRQAFLVANPLGYRSELMSSTYKKPSLLPRMPWKSMTAPVKPQGLTAAVNLDQSVSLSWQAPPAGSGEYDKVRRYAVYRSTQPALNLEDPAQLVGLTNAGETWFTDSTAVPGQFYYYQATALNRLHNESLASNTITNDVQPPVLRTRPVTRTLVNGLATVSAADVDAGSSDNWGIVSLQLSQTQFDCRHVGSNTVQLTAVDKGGNSASAPTQVNIVGVRPQPSIRLSHTEREVPGAAINPASQGQGVRSLVLTASDLAAGSQSRVVWLPAPGLIKIDGATARFVPTANASTTYRVRLTNQYGCSAEGAITLGGR